MEAKEGGIVMSNMLMELEGCCCSILCDDGEYLTGSADIACEVLAIDEEWIKVSFTDRHGRRVVRIERVDTVERVEIYRQ